MTTPERVLNGAAYPLTIDPVVSPEYPASDPCDPRAVGQQAGSKSIEGSSCPSAPWAANVVAERILLPGEAASPVSAQDLQERKFLRLTEVVMIHWKVKLGYSLMFVLAAIASVGGGLGWVRNLA